ncbi:AGAP012220-PA [Anopheles gambiae str. PEST]|uniref:AGAP012220-PA n=1 Tax=Anopheles gambiae TaxID=7165 RepID=Q7Q025_ANOGA|nr:AGAP012220-PA [Anopheles gambiae str. PEST]
MVKLHLVCGVLLFAFLGWAHGLPVKEQELEEVLTKLQELKRLNDGQLKQVNEEKLQQLGGASTNGQRTAGGASSAAAGGIAGAASSGFKTKRSLNNSDRRTLLYNYYSRGLAPMYDKRNFDEIDRFARFNGKRNLDYEPSYTGSADHNGYNGRFSKRNFDEIDRFNGKFASTAKCEIA